MALNRITKYSMLAGVMLYATIGTRLAPAQAALLNFEYSASVKSYSGPFGQFSGLGSTAGSFTYNSVTNAISNFVETGSGTVSSVSSPVFSSTTAGSANGEETLDFGLTGQFNLPGTQFQNFQFQYPPPVGEEPNSYFGSFSQYSNNGAIVSTGTLGGIVTDPPAPVPEPEPMEQDLAFVSLVAGSLVLKSKSKRQNLQ